jgi:hypothetical protein
MIITTKETRELALASLAERVVELERENTGLRRERNEVDQILGRLLGYPEHPESKQIITGENTVLSLCDEVVKQTETLQQAIGFWRSRYQETVASEKATFRTAIKCKRYLIVRHSPMLEYYSLAAEGIPLPKGYPWARRLDAVIFETREDAIKCVEALKLSPAVVVEEWVWG